LTIYQSCAILFCSDAREGREEAMAARADRDEFGSETMQIRMISLPLAPITRWRFGVGFLAYGS
jgi:hypothetical protein